MPIWRLALCAAATAMALSGAVEPAFGCQDSKAGLADVTSDPTADAVEAETTSDARRRPPVRPGNYLRKRGDFDPHPFDQVPFGDGLVFKRDYFEAKNARWRDRGLSIGGYFSPNFQMGSNGEESHGVGEFLLIGAWEPIREGNRAGRLTFGFAHDQTVGRLTTRRFADSQVLVETPDDLDTDPDRTFTTLGLLAWEQETWTSPDSGWGYRAGQLFAPAFFGLTVYLDDDRQFFMARPLAAAAGAQWVGANDVGLGAQLLTWRRGLYATLAIMDGDSDRMFPDLTSLLDGRLLYLGEIGFEKNVDRPNEFAIRLTVSHLDETTRGDTVKPPGESVILSIERNFDNRWALAARWSKSLRRYTADYRELYSLGLLLLNPSQSDDNALGFGVFSGNPADPNAGVESGAEVFYKVRLSQDISVTPDVQYWQRRDPDDARVRAWVYGLRLNFEF